MTYFKDGIEYETVGGIDIPLPVRPAKTKIGNYGLPLKYQKFKPTILPDSFKRLQRNSDGEMEYTADQNEFIKEELKRILNGYWFYNNGQETYITGYHYAELNYWKIDVGLKEYRDRDRRVHLHWKYCENDNNSYGQIYMKHRRDGATHRACCVNFFRTIQYKNSHSGIQSKTGTDAGKVFKKLVTAWRKLPSFLHPIHEGTTFPKKSLNFFEPAERVGKNNRKVKATQAIESWIDFAPSQSEAYDGEKLGFFHLDEAGKTIEADVSETWTIAKECLSLGNRIVGKCMITSTVAEMEKKGGKNFKKIWEQSDRAHKDANGRTISGLYRLFIPAYDGMEGFIDEYGNSKIEEAKQYLSNKREGLKAIGDSTGLANEKRLYPWTEEEALRPDGNKCLFDAEKILTRIEELTYKRIVERGDFVWENGKRDTRVIFQHNKNGKFAVAWLPERPEDNNKVIRTGERYDIDEDGNRYLRNLYKPDNTIKFAIGIDPYDHKSVSVGEGSKGAAYVYRKYNTMDKDDPWNDNFVVQYLRREKMPKIFYEDMIKICVFFGCQCLVETNKPGILDYFETRGYTSFLMNKPRVLMTKREHATRPDDTIGAAASEKSHQEIAERLEEYIFENCRTPFVEQLEDWLEFDISETEKYDATMASGWTLIASRKFIKAKSEPINATELFTFYDNSGDISMPIAV